MANLLPAHLHSQPSLIIQSGWVALRRQWRAENKMSVTQIIRNRGKTFQADSQPHDVIIVPFRIAG
jgi:hypothetical protein